MQQDNPKMKPTTSTFRKINYSKEIGKNKKNKMMVEQRRKTPTCGFTSGLSYHYGSKIMVGAATSSDHNHLEFMVL